MVRQYIFKIAQTLTGCVNIILLAFELIPQSLLLLREGEDFIYFQSPSLFKRGI
jgi:hypothetical protein